MKNIFIVLCVDVEPDRFPFGGKRYDYVGFQRWDGIVKGIPRFLHFRRNLQRELDLNIRLTWFFRSDSQIKRIYNHAAWPIEHYKEIVVDLQDEGDEIGWHAHTWRLNEKRGSWYQETNDKGWIISCYEQGFLSFKKTLGSTPTSFRAGWCFHNNISMAMLENLGIKVDLSAMPGIKNPGKANPHGSLFCNFADWERTGIYPYHPSREDYQIPGDDHYQLLEIPMTTFKAPLFSCIHKILPFRVIGELKFAKPEYTSLCVLYATFHPYLFEKGVKSASKRSNHSDSVYLVGSFHADDLLSKKLVANLSNNIRKIVSACKKSKFAIKFVTATEAYKSYKTRLK